MKSQCQPMCGNGDINVPEGEECDDGNRVDEDGCSSACKEEVEKFQCLTVPTAQGDFNSSDCYEKPFFKIKSISPINEVTLEFSEIMKSIELSEKVIEIWVKGIGGEPHYPYESLGFKWTSRQELIVNVTGLVIQGQKRENLTVLLKEDAFFTSKGIQLRNRADWSYPF